MKIAFIGLGIMGGAMASNLMKSGHELIVYNRTPGPADNLVKAGAKKADSLKQCVEDASVVFTMLANPGVVEKLALGEEGFLQFIKQNNIWVDCSTNNPSFTLKCAEEAQKKHIRFIDAPVAGSKPVAESGELIFFVGAGKEDYDYIKPVLQAMGKSIIYAGETGKGSSFKILVNNLLGQSLLAFSETIILGLKMGFSKEMLFRLLPELPVSSPFVKAKAIMMNNNNFSTQFALELMEKDFRLLLQTAKENELEMEMAKTAAQVYTKAMESGLGREDIAAIFKYLEEDKLPS